MSQDLTKTSSPFMREEFEKMRAKIDEQRRFSAETLCPEKSSMPEDYSWVKGNSTT